MIPRFGTGISFFNEIIFTNICSIAKSKISTKKIDYLIYYIYITIIYISRY